MKPAFRFTPQTKSRHECTLQTGYSITTRRNVVGGWRMSGFARCGVSTELPFAMMTGADLWQHFLNHGLQRPYGWVTSIDIKVGRVCISKNVNLPLQKEFLT